MVMPLELIAKYHNIFSMISLYSKIESRDKDVSILFKIIRGRKGDDVHYAMAVSDKNRFPAPFDGLAGLSCGQYNYEAYGRMVKCIDAETFIGLLEKVAAFNKNLPKQ